MTAPGRRLVLAALALLVPAWAGAAAAATAEQRPIIDMHFHVLRFTERPAVEAAHQAMLRHNVVKAVASGPAEEIAALAALAPDRVVASPLFPVLPEDFLTPGFVERREWPDLGALRAAYRDGRYAAMGEITTQYAGLAADDAALEPYFALAEELDLPVGIHLAGFGAPGFPDLRVELGRPHRLEAVLARHPRLRLYVMHAGWPYLEEMKALLFTYPQVHAELATIDWLIPREEFHAYLQELLRAGFGKRLMFGSDFWGDPTILERAIEGVESAAFLTAEQKRDIFHDNAARFLRLAPAPPAAGAH
jgi:predicted TIM-barrel fold metal-dependent hydrolase